MDYDPDLFTQGLYLDTDHTLYISSGLYGQSHIRAIESQTGTELRRYTFDETLFAEGLTVIHDSLFVCTWKAQRCFEFDKQSFLLIRSFDLPTRIWGITHTKDALIISDGTDTLYFYDHHFQFQHHITVTQDHTPIQNINELEWIDGQLYANIWKTSSIVVIDPLTGTVTQELDFSQLPALLNQSLSRESVLNGIAYDRSSHQLWVTGKHWNTLFKIQL